MTEKEALLLNKLKNWRNNLAKKLGKPSYYILSNRDLNEVIDKRPKKPSDFLELKGWGRKKAEKYGKDILAMLEGEANKGNLDTENFEEIQKNPRQEFSASDVEKAEPVFSVSEFIDAINIMVSRLGKVKIKGEISAVSGTERGYAFFDLRDSENEECLIKCIIFRQSFQYFSHFIEEGAEVIISGGGNIYPKNGSFRVVVESIEPVGEGAYKKALEKLKQKLSSLGYFDPERKRPIPFFIKKIGLITSSHGAAIRDFQKNVGNYGFEIYFKNVYVEGDYAEQSIVEAFHYLNKNNPDLDVIVLIRGGGGWESLKAFNGEKIAEAVITSRIPVITGIGHEPDETIAGLSSDKDCSTPTAAANFIRKHREKLIEMAGEYKNNLVYAQEKAVSRLEEYLTGISSKFQRTADAIFNRLEQLKERIKNLISGKIIFLERKEDAIKENKGRIFRAVESKIFQLERTMEIVRARIDSANPDYIFQKGYSAVFDKDGKVVKNSADLKIGQEVEIKFNKGKAKAGIKEIFSAKADLNL